MRGTKRGIVRGRECEGRKEREGERERESERERENVYILVLRTMRRLIL